MTLAEEGIALGRTNRHPTAGELLANPCRPRESSQDAYYLYVTGTGYILLHYFLFFF